MRELAADQPAREVNRLEMAQHREIATDELADPLDGPSMALARTFSIIFSPPFVAIATYLFVAFAEPQPLLAGLGWALLTIMLQMLPGTILYISRRKSGRYQDADVSRRQDRNELYLVGALAVFVSIVVLNMLGAPRPMQALAIGTLALGVLCGLVNIFWKISMHAATIAVLATITAFYTASVGVGLWACVLAVGWARVKTRNHTPMQVLAGMVAAAVVMYTAFVLVAR